MEIVISSEYRIVSDCHQWIAQKKNKDSDKAGAKAWTNIGYYEDLGRAISRLSELRIRNLDGLATARYVQAAIEDIRIEARRAAEVVKQAATALPDDPGRAHPARPGQRYCHASGTCPGAL